MFVIGNWKMNGNRELAQALTEALREHADELNQVQVGVCPPAVLLASLNEAAAETELMIGGQDVNEHQSGAHTGEHSTELLSNFGAEFTLIGHSERRQFYGDSMARVAAKVAATLANSQLTVVLCVGESEAERQAEQTFAVIAEQLETALQGQTGDCLERLIIAYEPVWAIGTGLTASPEQAQQVHEFIRSWLVQKFGAEAANVALLYGGSVKPENAEALFAQQDIDGGLIGGASLQVDAFIAIAKAAATRSK